MSIVGRLVLSLALAVGAASCSGPPGAGSTPTGSPSPSTHTMDHGVAPRRIIPVLCRIARAAERGDHDVYATYSSQVHDPLHEVMNDARAKDRPGAVRLVRAENRLEIALLAGGDPPEIRLWLQRVVRAARPLIGHQGHGSGCGRG